jgi:SAM-dependent methyltransferase
VAAALKQDGRLHELIAGAEEFGPQSCLMSGHQGATDWATLSDALLIGLLQSTAVCDIALERFLTSIRQAILEIAASKAPQDEADPDILPFACALARQCFINEYVFAVSDDETDQLSRLREATVARLTSGDVLPALWLAILAAYQPLSSLPAAHSILDRPWSDMIDALLTQQIREPLEDRAARNTIPRLTPIADAISLQVQEQYEENPYPRWVSTAATSKPSTVDVYLRRQLPLASIRPSGKDERVDILIAGCGTGQHAIETALRFSNAEVLAVDLSLTSLAYAKRKSRAAGLTNLQYEQADILELGTLDRRFDLIEAGGVLHHLADPLAGWRVLLAILRSKGVMRVGLYSELARSRIVAVRAFIAARGYSDTAHDIRKFRQDLMQAEPDVAAALAAECRDFFTTSECRDLLFHRHEHRFTLPAIKSFLAEYGLDLLGFDLEGHMLDQFRQRFPDRAALTDLDRWHQFEIENPRTFAGMYQFYVQKP